jgi:hypothetical protein
VIGGVRCDHLLFQPARRRLPGLDCRRLAAVAARYTVTDTSTPALLSITTLLSNWKELPAVDDAMFRFVPPKGAQQIRFLSVEPARPIPGK